MYLCNQVKGCPTWIAHGKGRPNEPEEIYFPKEKIISRKKINLFRSVRSCALQHGRPISTLALNQSEVFVRDTRSKT